MLDIIGPQNLTDLPRLHRLGLAAGVGLGELFSAHLGQNMRYEYVVWGEALADIVRAVQTVSRAGFAPSLPNVLLRGFDLAFCPQPGPNLVAFQLSGMQSTTSQSARPGQALVSQDVFDIAGELLTFQSPDHTPSQEAQPSALLTLRSVLEAAAGVNVAANRLESDTIAESLAATFATDSSVGQASRDEVMHYIAGSERAVINRGGVTAAKTNRSVLSCTVMVLKLSTEYRNQASLQRTQRAIRLIMRVLYRHEAAFKHFVQMGNGGVVVTAFGLPPFTMPAAACARRACSAGATIHSKLLEIGVQCTVGVSSGTCCIGSVPGVDRIATILLGKPVALATQMANACTARRPMIMDDICFQVGRAKSQKSFFMSRRVCES